ncbi:hypothetical protein ATX81_09965 [Oenococcus oeni]|nr:hypothetical protein ATX81_09965 [Oenococcus oeni]
MEEEKNLLDAKKQNILENSKKSILANKISVKKNDKFYALLFLGPSLLLLILFIFYPMLKTIYLSLFLTNGNGQNTVFVGLENNKDCVLSIPIRQEQA